MCYSFARFINEGLLLPSKDEYFCPLSPMEMNVVVRVCPGSWRTMWLSWLRLKSQPSTCSAWICSSLWRTCCLRAYPKSLFVEGGVATYVSQRRIGVLLPLHLCLPEGMGSVVYRQCRVLHPRLAGDVLV